MKVGKGAGQNFKRGAWSVKRRFSENRGLGTICQLYLISLQLILESTISQARIHEST